MADDPQYLRTTAGGRIFAVECITKIAGGPHLSHVPLGGSKAGPFRAYAPVSLPDARSLRRKAFRVVDGAIQQRSSVPVIRPVPPVQRQAVPWSHQWSLAQSGKVPSNLGGEQHKTECSGYFFGWIWDMVVGGMRHGMR
eukprot:symbB.v1.2.027632.t2/scaffold2846.1/size68995/4